MKTVIELAKEAGVTGWHPERGVWYEFTEQQLLSLAALVRAERDWVDLTFDEIAECFVAGDEIDSANAVIAAFKEKNK